VDRTRASLRSACGAWDWVDWAGQVGHDIKYTLGLLGRYLPDVEVGPLDDTMLLSFVLDAGAPT
jgi:hypothetical protein